MAAPSDAAPNLKPLARRVFISYARKDGADAAQSIRKALREAGCEVWLDTDRIRGGASWGKDIEDALNNCEVLVALLTPASYVSEICRAEQIWALDEGKAVIPVLAVAGAPVPIHLKSRNYRKYPEQQAELLMDISADAHIEHIVRPLRYDTVPNLPLNYVIREKQVTGLRDLVFTEGAGANIAVTALQGMGGIGKTVLATAVCRDPAVQRAFPDGIAWITIGREWDGDFVPRMREVGRALGEDVDRGWDTKQACENRYKTILREKAALVVVDDIWSLEHVQPLLVDAPRSRFLITTRDATIANALTDRNFSANLLSDGEARELLARAARIEVTALPPEAAEIIHECGRLAAALSQIGGSLKGKAAEDWRDTLEALKRADISEIEERLPTGQKSFFKSLEVSFQTLPAHMQNRYLKLAVLLEDVPAALPVLQVLWKLNEEKARHTVRYLVERSLASWVEGIKLHDLQLDYVRARFSDPAALHLIHGALRLSANVVAQNPEEFASQMVGRLLPHEEIPAIAEFTRDIAKGASKPWLKPLWPSLHPPGTALIRTLAGHSAWVRAVALTPDGHLAVSASDDHLLKVWDLASGTELHTLRGHSKGVWGVTVTQDGRLAVSASKDKTLKVWELTSGKEVRTLVGHSDSVAGVAVMADGRRAVSASWDKTLKVWDLESGKEVRTVAGHSDVVNGVAVMADGRRAVSASYDKTLKVWDLESGKEVRTVAGHSDSVEGVAVKADGRRAVSACYDNTLKVWDLESGKEVRTLEGHSDWVTAMAVTSDGRRAVSASKDNTLKVWDLESGKEVRTLAGHADVVSGVAVTADGRRAVSASFDKTLKVWDLESGKELRTLAGHLGSVRGVAVTTDGRCAVSASKDNTLKVWDLESGKEVRTLAGHSGSVRGVALTADGRRTISASWDNTLKVWDLERGTVIAGFTCDAAAICCAFAGADLILAGDEGGRLYLLKLETG